MVDFAIKFEELLVWQKARAFSKEVYLVSKDWRDFELKDQIRRAVVSISSNIAEGRGRNSRKDFIQFLHIAQGSLFELETQLILVKDLYKIDIRDILKIIEEEQKMLSGMIRKLKITKS